MAVSPGKLLVMTMPSHGSPDLFLVQPGDFPALSVPLPCWQEVLSGGEITNPIAPGLPPQR